MFLSLTEPKRHESFLTNQFYIDVFLPSFRLDRTWGGDTIYVSDDMSGMIFHVGYSPIIFFTLILKVKYFWKSILGGVNGCSSGVTTLAKTTYTYFQKNYVLHLSYICPNMKTFYFLETSTRNVQNLSWKNFAKRVM